MILTEFLLRTPRPCGKLVCATCGGTLGFSQAIRDYIDDPDSPPLFSALCSLPASPDPRLRESGETVMAIIRHLRLQPSAWRELAHAWADTITNGEFTSLLSAWLPADVQLTADADGRERQLLKWIRGLYIRDDDRHRHFERARDDRIDGPDQHDRPRNAQPTNASLPFEEE